MIDRINLHFKIGANALIPFSIEEKVFVARTDVAETFEEVLQIAVDVHEFSKSEQVMEAPVSAAQDSETESTDGEQSEQQEQTEAQVESSEDQPNTQGGASSSGGADLEDVRDDWYDEDGNLTEPEEEGSAGWVVTHLKLNVHLTVLLQLFLLVIMVVTQNTLRFLTKLI